MTEPPTPEARAPLHRVQKPTLLLRPRTFGLVAGEASGDLLGAGLIDALRARYPTARFVGIGGPLMQAAGLDSWYPAEKLSVMGLVEVIKHLPELLRIRADVRRRMTAARPDAFIGIDAPDFNLGLERALKSAGIRTVHYVSPSVWAWREGRAAKIGRSADLVLCLFPMEPPIYQRYKVNARFVGHPLADQFPLVNDRVGAREQLGLRQDAPVLALLPGSRLGEIGRLGADFLDAARRCQAAMPGLQVVAPMATPACAAAFAAAAAQTGVRLQPLLLAQPLEPAADADTATAADDAANAPTAETDPPLAVADAVADAAAESAPIDPASGLVLTLQGHSHAAMLAADVVLLASGTAALEAMLAKRPMVVAYKIAPMTYRLVTWFKLMRSTRFSLPNVLAGRDLVPEILQDACTPAALASAVLQLLGDSAARIALVAEFERLHDGLKGDADRSAAAAIAELVNRENVPGGGSERAG